MDLRNLNAIRTVLQLGYVPRKKPTDKAGEGDRQSGDGDAAIFKSTGSYLPERPSDNRKSLGV